MRILGIDSSLTGTGLSRATIEDHDAYGTIASNDPRVHTVELATVGARKPKPTDTWLHTSERVHEVLDQVKGALCDGVYDAVGLEELAYGAKGDAVVKLHWLWGEIIYIVATLQYPLYLVNASAVKKFATGNGNAKKDVVMLAMANRYPTAAIKDNNQADALAVSMIVARKLGVPFDTAPQANIPNLDKVVLQ